MFNKIIVTFCIIMVLTNSIKLHHQENFNASQLTQDQRKVNNFILNSIPGLKDAALADGKQDRTQFILQYTSKDAPFKLTDVQVSRLKDESFRLGKVVTSETVPLPKGRLTKKTTIQSSSSLQNGMNALNF